MGNPNVQTVLQQLGDVHLDEEHQELHELAALLSTASERCVHESFNALRSNVRAHFSREDELMRSHQFSSKDCHLDEHAAVLRSFDDVGVALASGRVDVARRFAARFLEWLPEHVDALDRHLANVLFRQKTGGAAIVVLRRQEFTVP